MKKTLIALLILTACQPSNREEDVDTKFKKREYTHTAWRQELREYDTQRQLELACKALNAQWNPQTQNLMDCVEIGKDRSWCRVHIVKPEKVYAPGKYGHPFGHCAWGRFHD